MINISYEIRKSKKHQFWKDEQIWSNRSPHQTIGQIIPCDGTEHVSVQSRDMVDDCSYQKEIGGFPSKMAEENTEHLMERQNYKYKSERSERAGHVIKYHQRKKSQMSGTCTSCERWETC